MEIAPDNSTIDTDGSNSGGVARRKKRATRKDKGIKKDINQEALRILKGIYADHLNAMVGEPMIPDKAVETRMAQIEQLLLRTDSAWLTSQLALMRKKVSANLLAQRTTSNALFSEALEKAGAELDD